MQDSIRIPPEQWGRAAVRTELPGAQSKISKVGSTHHPQCSLRQLPADITTAVPTHALTRLPAGEAAAYTLANQHLERLPDTPEHKPGQPQSASAGSDDRASTDRWGLPEYSAWLTRNREPTRPQAWSV